MKHLLPSPFHHSAALLVVVLLCLAPALSGVAAERIGSRGLTANDLLEITVAGDTVIALQAGSSSRRLQLLPGEIVRSLKSRGRVGILVTSERLLAISAEPFTWQTLALSPQETTAASSIASSLALFTTRERVIFFDALRNRFQSYDLAPGASVIGRALLDRAGIWATADQVGGYALGGAGFSVFTFSAGETFRTIQVSRDQLAALTSKRILLFQAETGRWRQQELPPGGRGRE